jgi:hypothetical protein
MSRDRTARTRIRQFLATSGPIVDPSGYATGVLKDSIGYTGSSVAFIQLIAAMDRDGEIEREIRGKRTYKIEGIGVPPTPSVGAVAPMAQAGTVATVGTPGQPTIELDYKLLAQALVRELLAATAAAKELTGAASASSDGDRVEAERDEYARRLEIARNQLDELLGQPIGAMLRGDDSVRSAD